jgi:hypothetical protein
VEKSAFVKGCGQLLLKEGRGRINWKSVVHGRRRDGAEFVSLALFTLPSYVCGEFLLRISYLKHSEIKVKCSIKTLMVVSECKGLNFI